MKQYRITTQELPKDGDDSDCYISPEDPMHDMIEKETTGLTFKVVQEDDEDK